MKQLLLICVLLATTLTTSFAQYSSGGENDECFRTQTIGGWGATPSGNNPGAYLHEHFDDAFGGGIVIGTGQNTVTFTSAEAITKFLPSGGTAMAIEEAYIDPSTRELKNTLVSQVLALTISTSLDVAIEDYSASNVNIAYLEVAAGPFEGLMVKEVLDEANKVLSGEASEYSVDQLNEAITKINESYVDGDCMGSGFLVITSRSESLSRS